MKKIQLTDLLIFIVSAELVGAAAALFVGDFSLLYETVQKPPLSPPAWLFPVVWTILYALMGISAYIVYSSGSDGKERKTALGIYTIQLAVNFIWTLVYFKAGSLLGGAGVILVLLALIVLMIILFGKVSKLAAVLNIPYLLWAIFASYLNIAAVIINLFK